MSSNVSASASASTSDSNTGFVASAKRVVAGIASAFSSATQPAASAVRRLVVRPTKYGPGAYRRFGRAQHVPLSQRRRRVVDQHNTVREKFASDRRKFAGSGARLRSPVVQMLTPDGCAYAIDLHFIKNKSNIEVAEEGNAVRVRGVYTGRRSGKQCTFDELLPLPYNTITSNIRAHFANGELVVFAPRARGVFSRGAASGSQIQRRSIAVL